LGGRISTLRHLVDILARDPFIHHARPAKEMKTQNDTRTQKQLEAALDQECANINEAMTNMHAAGVSMLEALEELERNGSPFLKSEEFSDLRGDLPFIAEALSQRSPDLARRIEALFNRLDTE
jgi:hypothetical protein